MNDKDSHFTYFDKNTLHRLDVGLFLSIYMTIKEVLLYKLTIKYLI